MIRYASVLCLFITAIIFPAFSPSSLQAQIQSPDDRYLFREDAEIEQDRLSKQREGILEIAPPPDEQVDFSAPTVNFDNEKNIARGSGGVLISGQGYRVEGEEGEVNLNTKDVKMKGNVLITGPQSVVEAEEAEFNLDSEIGDFKDATFTLEEGAYSVDASEVKKVNDTEFELTDCILSTCHCSDGTSPWDISSSDVSLEKEGYAHTYNAKVRFWEIPILYTPWLAFPIKQERSSGLLVPQFGYSDRDGLALRLPTYIVLDGSSDMTVTPFTQTRTRTGLQLEYREAFSGRSSLETKMVYSDESQRDGSFRGTDITGIAEPEIDENRVGVYAAQNWSNSPSSDVPMSLVSDIHYVSDTLFLREMEDSDFGLASSRYATSRVAYRAGLNDYTSASIVNEYNQALVSPQETTFQRLPEITLNSTKSYRPFGFNPYGLKVTPKFQFTSVNFRRESGYDGFRYDFNPSVKVPFHYKNYFNSEFIAQFNQTFYELDETGNPSGDPDLDDSTNRGLWRFSYNIGTILERVYDLPQENILTTLTSIGSRNQTHRLQRVKHTWEPGLTFDYVPGTNQDDLPLFDSFDRVRKRSLITADLMTRLLGSFGYQQGAQGDFEEFTNSLDELTPLDTLSPLTDFDRGSSLGSDRFGVPVLATRRENRIIRQLMSFRLVQSYDYVEDKNDLDPNREAFSDLGSQLYLNPTQDFGFGFASNYNVENQDFSSWNIASHLTDDRGDTLRARYTYVEDSVSQVEGNLEIPVTSRLRLGYYARYDESENEFIEQQAALRVSSACDCWHFDIGFSDEINPDRQRALFRLTLRGLGDLTQNLGFDQDNRDDQQ